VEENVASVTVDIRVPGYSNIEYVYGTTNERLYTLNGTQDGTGVRKRLRFAPGKYGRARLRLGHELSVLQALASNRLRHIPRLETVLQLPDKSLCAIFSYKPVKTFQEYSDFVHTLGWEERTGEILKFAQSLAALLSEIHLAGVFRTSAYVIRGTHVQMVIYPPNAWKYARMAKCSCMIGPRLYIMSSKLFLSNE
jgi:hypothetical protein